jgi:hypothetical protein
MNLRGIQAGDLVRLEADAALWEVERKDGRELHIRMASRPLVHRVVGAREVAEAWRKVRSR